MNTRPTYEWKISSSTPYIDDLLLSGYYRQHLSANIISEIMEIIRSLLDSQYHISGIPFGQCTINDIKNQRENSYTFVSTMFVTDSLKFYLSLKPIYRPHNVNWQFSITIRSCPASPPSNCYFTISLKELQMKSNPIVYYRRGNAPEVVFKNIAVNDVNNLNKLTIQVFKQHATNKNVIAKSIQLPSVQYRWYIVTSPDVDTYWSKPFTFGDFRCYFALLPSKASFAVYLHLYSLPKNLGEILVRTTVLARDNYGSGDGVCVDIKSNIAFTHSKLQNQIATFRATDARSITLCLDATIYEGYVKNQRENFAIVPNFIQRFSLSNPLLTPLKSSKYVWKLSDIDYNVPNMFGITSNIFSALLFKWYLNIYTNGINEDTKGQLCISLVLADKPATTVRALCTIRVLEIAFRWQQVICCDKDIIIIVDESSHISHYASLSVEVAFELLTINNIVNDMHHKCNDIETKPQQYIWKINKQYLSRRSYKPFMIVQSPIFEMYSMRWYLSVYPKSPVNQNTPSVKLTLESLPSIKTVFYTRCIFTINEPKKRYIMNGVFGAYDSGYDSEYDSGYDSQNVRISIEWGNDILSVAHLDTCMIQLDMELLDVYDHGLNISNAFMLENYDANDINLSEEEENVSDFELKSWFNDKVQLPQYYPVFVEHDIHTLSILKLVTINELNEMKITSIGHRIKILHEIEKLNSS
eukprot:491746_1